MITEPTDKEYRVLRAILLNDFTNVNGAMPENYADATEIWANSINDSAEPSGITGRSLSGVCSTLAQKGLIYANGRGEDATVRLTQGGYDAAMNRPRRSGIRRSS